MPYFTKKSSCPKMISTQCLIWWDKKTVFQAKNNDLLAKNWKNANFGTFKKKFPQKALFHQKILLPKGVYQPNAWFDEIKKRSTRRKTTVYRPKTEKTPIFALSKKNSPQKALFHKKIRLPKGVYPPNVWFDEIKKRSTKRKTTVYQPKTDFSDFFRPF